MICPHFRNGSLLLALCWLFALRAHACASDPWSVGHRLFINKLSVEHPLYKYQYSPDYFLYPLVSGWSFDDDSATRSAGMSIWDDWMRYFGARYSEQEIKAWVYNEGGITDKTYALWQKNKRKSKTREKIHTLKDYMLYEDTLLLRYMKSLADYQRYTEVDNDEWNYSHYVHRADSSALFSLVKEVEHIYRLAGNDFLRWRCAYHMVRMAHFHHYYDAALTLYTQYVEPLPTISSLIVAWAWGLRGGIASRLGQKEEAFYYFAKRWVSDQYNPNTFRDMKAVIGQINLKGVYGFCQNTKDSMCVNMAAGISSVNYSMDALRTGFRQGLHGESLRLLWHRELAKLEADYIRTRLYPDAEEVYHYFADVSSGDIRKSSKQHLQDLLQFTKTIVSALPRHEQAYYLNGLCYMYIVQGDFDAAKKINKQLSSYVLDPYDQLQWTTNKLLWTIKRKQKVEESLLLRYAKELQQTRIAHSDQQGLVQNFMNNSLAPALLAQKDTMDALAIWLWADNLQEDTLSFSYLVHDYLYYSMPLQVVRRFVEQGHTAAASSLLAWLQQHYVIDMQASYDALLARKYICRQEFDSALLYLRRLPLEEQQAKQYFDPTLLYFHDYRFPGDSEAVRFKRYNIIQLAELGMDWKHKACAANAGAMDKFRYGLYLYSITYYGYNAYFANREIMEYNDDSPAYYHNTTTPFAGYEPIFNTFRLPVEESVLRYYTCEAASDYFTEAMALFTDVENKANCCFMLAKCANKQSPVPRKELSDYGYYNDREERWKGQNVSRYLLHSLQNPWFRTMQSQYRYTSAYEQAYSECSVFRMYVDSQ